METNRQAFRSGLATGAFVGGMAVFLVMFCYFLHWQGVATERCLNGEFHSYRLPSNGN